MKNKLSVIIPVYNVEKFLKESVDSILNQKEFLHEIILVDDGSTDGSSVLLDELYADYDFIKIVHKQNEGQGPSRNLGTSIATGDFIYYFDSDDICKPGLFKQFYRILSKDPELELFCFSAESFLDQGYLNDPQKETVLNSQKPYQRTVIGNFNSGEEAFNKLHSQKTFFAVPYLYIFKKSILTNNSVQFRPIRYEDEEFTHQLFIFAKKTVISNDVYCMRRVRKGSVMQKQREFADLIGYFKTVEKISELINRTSIKSETRNNLEERTKGFIKNVLIINARNRIKKTWFERKLFFKHLFPFIQNDKSLLKIFLLHSTEYKLRKIKSRIFH